MSIEFSPAFDRCTGTRATKASARRVAANRRNATRSTGPRTAAGKRRASRNAIKHGLCSTRVCLPGECAATYATFVREIEEEFQPRTAMQYALVPHIANLMWRINRLPQAQADIFERELRKVRGRGQQLTASQLLARRFSDDPSDNGFLLISRYERGLHNQLHRLLSRFDTMQRRRPTTTLPLDEPPVPDEMQRPAWTEEMQRKQIEAFARRTRALDAGNSPPPANDYERSIDDCILTCRAQREQAKRTQSNPMENRKISPKSEKSAENDNAPATKRTHYIDAVVASDSPGRLVPLSPCHPHSRPLPSSAPKIHGDSDAIRDDIQQPQHEQESEPWPT